MDGSKKGWLEWYLDFIQMDLGGVNLMERGRLCASVALIDQGDDARSWRDTPYVERVGVDDVSVDVARLYLNLHDRYDLTLIQRHLKKFFNEFVENFIELGMFLEDGCSDKPIGETPLRGGWTPTMATLSTDLRMSLNASIPEPVGGWPAIALPGSVPENRISCIFEKDASQNISIKLRIRARSIEEEVLVHFMRMLEGSITSTDALKRCKECQRWFLHSSRRERVFCSNTCAARHGMRKRRSGR
ncbi:MAG: DUF6076 domain-containing protein [Syntrophobacteraceae bacterium]